MSATLRPYCSRCRGHYRGIYPVHASTGQHLRNLTRTGRQNTHDVKAALGYRSLSVRRALAGDDGSGKVKVRAYRRSRPDDGRAKVVHVKRYWRDRVWRAVRLRW
jgi:hypothetical protein